MILETTQPGHVRQVVGAALAIARHEAARNAWLRATTSFGVGVARDLSRAAASATDIDAAWLEELEAACIDAEAEHAADLHTQAINTLSANALSHSGPKI